jgi:transcriptional regulator with XRE-family HTH domain
MTVDQAPSSGELLRQARKNRRLSQLDLALRVGASQRHLSFLETGRSSASRGMLIALADALGMSPSGCNQLLLASGFAPRYGQRPLHDREMEPVRQALEHLLEVHDPFPAWVLDPCWNLLQANRGADRLVTCITGRGLSAEAGSINLLEAILHEQGLRLAIENFDEVAAHLYHQSHAEAAHTPALARLLQRLEPSWPDGVKRPAAGDDRGGGPAGQAFPGPADGAAAGVWPSPGGATEEASLGVGAAHERFGTPRSPVLATRLRTPAGRLSFFSTFTTFGTPLDITVASLRVEHQFPADEETRQAMRELAAGR